MIILPQVKELQKGNLTDLNGTGGSLPAGNYRNITGTFSSVGSDCTSVVALNFNATITNTGAAVTSPYTYNYPSTWSRITTNDYNSIPSVTLNSGSNGTPGGTGGGGGGAAGGGATAGGNGGAGGPGGCGAFGVRWDEVPVFVGFPMNNTAYACPGLGGSGGTGAAGSPSINGVNGYPGNNGVPPIISNKIYSWGANNLGQMGIGFSSLSPTCTATAICSSLNFFCMSRTQNGSVYALTTDCKLYVWGNNDFGQLGVCNTINRSLPENICPNCNFNRICLTANSAYVFGTDNRLYSTGRNHVGQLGDGTTTNRVALFNICSSCQFNNIRSDISNDDLWASGVSLFAFDVNNRLFAWGCNNCGQLGNGNITNQCLPVAICSTCTFKCIYSHCCFTTAAIDSNDKLFLWGNNNVGQVGNGNITTQCLPVAICPSCNFRHITLDIGITNTYTYALGTDCRLYAWGDNSTGQLGNGNTTNQCLPVAICPTCTFICVYTRCGTSFALTTNYKLFAWGCNNNGRLGDGTSVNKCLPTAICTACSFRDIFQSWDSSSTYALGIDDRLYSWGQNNCGQLGNGNIISQCLPVAICSACRFKCIFVPPAANYVFAVDVNNKIYSWGQNSAGELGYGNLISQCLPSIVCDNLLFVDNNILIRGIGGNSIITTAGGNCGRGGNTYTITAPAGGIGGAGGGGGGGGQSIFCRYSYPTYFAQNLDALPTPNSRFHGNGGTGASGNTSGATAGGTGQIPAASWPATTSRSGTGGAAGTASPVADATAGGNGGCIITAGPGPMPSSGSPGDLGSPSDTCTFGGGGAGGSNASPGANGTGTSAGSTGSVGNTGSIGTFPSAGGGGGGRGGTGGSGVIQALGANGGAGGAGSGGGAGGKAGKTLALMVYNSVSGSIFSFGGSGSTALSGSPGTPGQTCTHPNGTSYTGACGGNGGVGGSGGQGSAGRILLVGRNTVFCNNPEIIAPSGEGKLYIVSSCALTSVNNSCNYKLVQSQKINGSMYVLDQNCKLFAKGSNSVGQLGNGNTTTQSSFVPVCSSCSFKCVLAHEYCSNVVFAIDSNNKIYSWGSNFFGQLGNGNTTNQCVPVAVCSSCDFNCVLTNAFFTYAITTNCKLFAWGRNNFGQLGIGNTTDQCQPVAICSSCSFTSISASTLSSGFCSFYAIGVDGKLYSWGCNTVGQLGDGSTVDKCSPVEVCSACCFSSVISADRAVFAITNTGKLFTWGYNCVGQLGNGTIVDSCTPGIICGSCNFSYVTHNCNSTHALTTDGKLFTWGDNNVGQLGNGNTTAQCSPVAICSSCSFAKIYNVASSIYALTTDCKLFTWGSNFYGQLGNGNTTNQCLPVAICPNCSFCCIEVYEKFPSQTCSIYAIDINGKLYAWGSNFSGLLANGTTVNQCRPSMICPNLKFSAVVNIFDSQMAAISSVIENKFLANGITTGENGINGAGDKLYSWGRNDVGQIGIGTTVTQCTPIIPQSLGLDYDLSKTCNKSNHVVVINCCKQLFTWGCNSVGQVGSGNTNNCCVSHTPCSSCCFRYAAAYCCPDGFGNSIYLSHAIDINGKLYIWGCNHTGLVGDGTKTNRCLPVNICPSCTFFDVETDGCSTYTLTTDYKILTWGCNNCGQLGNGSNIDTSFPTPVCPSSNFICLHVANAENSPTTGTSIFAIDSNNRLYSWGANTVGELGDNSIVNKCSPVNICSACTFMCITSSANSKSIFALTTDCKLFSWGSNANNQLGNGDVNALPVCAPTAICSSCTFNCIVTCQGSTYAITTNCKLFGWGNNVFGQAGVGLVCSSNQTTPAAICSTCNFFFVATNGNSTYALTTDCKLFSWGRNLDGNLGDGTTVSKCLPVAICPLCSFNCVYTRFATAYAIGIDGKLYAWGSNNCGQIGNNTIINQCSPVNICPNFYFTAVSIGLCGCGVMATANCDIGAGGTGGTWSSFATLSCGTPGTPGIRGTAGTGGTITSATPGQSAVYCLT